MRVIEGFVYPQNDLITMNEDPHSVERALFLAVPFEDHVWSTPEHV